MSRRTEMMIDQLRNDPECMAILRDAVLAALADNGTGGSS